MGCEHTRTDCSSDLGCFGSDKLDSGTQWVLLWLEKECSQRDAIQFIVVHALTLAAQAQSAQPEDPARLSKLRYVAFTAVP